MTFCRHSLSGSKALWWAKPEVDEWARERAGQLGHNSRSRGAGYPGIMQRTAQRFREDLQDGRLKVDVNQEICCIEIDSSCEHARFCPIEIDRMAQLQSDTRALTLLP